MSNGRGWVETDVDEAEEAFNEWGKGRERTVKPPDGDTTWFVMPPRVGASQGAKPFLTGKFVHFVHDPKDPSAVLAVGVCPTKSRNQPCVVCAYLSRLRKAGGDADQEFIDSTAAKENILCNAVRLDGDDDDLKVEVLQVPVEPFKQLNQILRDRAEGMDFTHPQKGAPVIFNRSGKGKKKTRYTARLAKPRALPDMALLDQMIDLDSVYPELDHEGLRAVFVLPEAPTPAPVDRQIAGK